MLRILAIQGLFLQVAVATFQETSCYQGSYKVQAPPFGSCSGYRHCEKGYFCESGQRQICPSGSFGASIRLTNSTCSGLCQEGFYCPAGSTTSTPNYCGSPSLYCPRGSSAPLVAQSGFYTVDDQGHDFADSQTRRTNVKVCEVGYFCEGGERHVCPSGTFGLVEGLSTAQCSGECPEGWHCPPKTVSPFAYPCSSSPRYYCPAGSDHPLSTEAGFFSVRSHVAEGGGFGATVVCPRGSFCQNGVRFDCPAGRYGASIQATNSSCSGQCTAGYYCPQGSIGAQQIQCADDSHFCPPGSAAPNAVRAGYFSIGTHDDPRRSPKAVERAGDNPLLGHSHVEQALCEPGHYCIAGERLFQHK